MNSPDSLCILHQVSHGLASPKAWHAASAQSAHPQLALPHGFLAVHSCGLHLHWPGGHLQLSPQAGHPMLSPVIREVTPCHSGIHTTAKVAGELEGLCDRALHNQCGCVLQQTFEERQRRGQRIEAIIQPPYKSLVTPSRRLDGGRSH